MAENLEDYNHQLGPKSGPYSAETAGLAQGAGGTVAPACAPPQGPQWHRLPAGLRERRQWCLAGADKAPMSVGADGEPYHASVTTPAQWLDFETVCREAKARGMGIGYVLTANDPFTCIDLDVKDAPDKPEAWTTPDQLARHERIVAAFDSYTELSRSGKGRHVWVFGNIGKGVRRDGVEVYSQERFIVCTGNVALNRPIQEGGEKLTNMAGQMRALEAGDAELRPDQPGDDSGAFLALYAIENEGELGRLMKGDWEGRHYPSHSEADFALMKEFARLSESNGACREAFRLSGLSKRTDKPNKYADKYLNLTLKNARAQLAWETAQIEHGRQLAEGLFWHMTAPVGHYFRLLLDNDMQKVPAPRWLVKGIIPETGIGAIYGDSGSYKSFLTLDLLAHIANGQSWFGRKAKVAPAVYVPFEGQGGIPSRIKAWRIAQSMARHPNMLLMCEPSNEVASNVAVITDPMSLRSPTDQEKLVSTLIDHHRAGGILCIDTLAHASSGLDENSSAMAEMITIFRKLQHRLGGVVLLVHHSGKDQSRGMRGWSGLHAAMDFVIECQRDGEGREAYFKLSKAKDGEDGDQSKFVMRLIPLGIDEDGDHITSLTVEPLLDNAEGDIPLAAGKMTKKEGIRGIRDIDGKTAAADDDFIFDWMKGEVTKGKHPSKNSLKGQLPDMKNKYLITQDRVAAAIERLLAAKRITLEPKSKNGNPWLRPVDAPQV